MHHGVSWVSMKCNLFRDTHSVESQGVKTETEDRGTAGTEETNGREPSVEVCVTKTEIGARRKSFKIVRLAAPSSLLSISLLLALLA